MKRAMDSVVASIGEGAAQIGKRRVEHYRLALGSAIEVSSHLQGAVAWGYVDDVSAATSLIDRVRAMLWRLTH
jgi:four helix bundle protein